MMERMGICLNLQFDIKGIASRKAARKATGANSGCITRESENQRLRVLREQSYLWPTGKWEQGRSASKT